LDYVEQEQTTVDGFKWGFELCMSISRVFFSAYSQAASKKNEQMVIIFD